MSDTLSWQLGNANYLAAVVAWVRERLEKLAPGEQAPAVPGRAATPPVQPTAQGLFSWSPSQRPMQTSEPSIIADQAGKIAAQSVASVYEPPVAMVQLSQRFGLSDFEENILLLCTAMEMDTSLAALCARVQDDPLRAYPTFALALMLFDNPSWDALVPERPLRYWRMIEINQPGATPLTVSALRVDERIVHYIKGANYLDDRLSTMLSPLDVDSDAEGLLPQLPPSQQEAAETILLRWRQTPAGRALPVVQLLGPDSSSKHLVAAHAASQIGYQLCRLNAEMLPSNQSELETLTRLWQRESMLLPLALYLDAQELDGGEGQVAMIHRFLAQNEGLLFLGIREALPQSGRASFAVDVDKPTPVEQQEAWESLLDLDWQDAKLLASQFNFNIVDIRRIAPQAMGFAAMQGAAGTHSAPAMEPASSNTELYAQDVVWELCRDNDRPRMDALAQRIDAKATWDDLVLPPLESNLLRQIVAQVRQRGTVYDEWGFRAKMNRGMGISALFAGSSGTGKTMAAEVIANELRLNLYRIDLSAVVSKYIGETEKNLRRLFDAAEGGSAILFFDEADALFGKRSEVKDSHDRYANIEVNYLLQRMEAYSGLAILATNMKSALDTAFTRRLRFIVNFHFPGLPERKTMWQKVFPAQLRESNADLAQLDYGKLARLNLSGASIHNVALNAAFAAAHANQKITMQTLWEAARMEFRKLQIPINEADFR